MSGRILVPRWGDSGWGRAGRYLDDDALPPQPPVGSKVQLHVYHPVMGRDPIFERLAVNWTAVGWISVPLTWRALVRINGHRAPKLLLEVVR